MMIRHLSTLCALLVGVAAAADSNVSVVCVPGECIQGTTNITIGSILSADGQDTSLHLFPGTYDEDTSPQLLHDMLTSSSASLSPSDGFQNSSSLSSLPLELEVAPGFSAYSKSLYSGSASYHELPSSPSNTSNSTSISAKSIALASNTWVAMSGGSNDRLVFWESIPDVSQLPTSSNGNWTLLDMQSTRCSPSCSSNGICTSSGTCACAAGFTGSSCEQCEDGFFGPSCTKCPEGCKDCDDGISGTGVCLSVSIDNDPSSCNCLNGACGSDGSCSCLPGWTKGSNGTECAGCADGYFLSTTGECKVCFAGCEKCADDTGACLSCKDGFTQDSADKTKCTAPSQTDSSGATCPKGSFNDNGSCKVCDSACDTCTGGTSKDCASCKSGTYFLDGSCVSAGSNGVCEGTTLIADNNKGECDTCSSKCTACEIKSFDVASTVDKAVCTGCIPGHFLSDGQCVSSCPDGSFIDPKDNMTCTACDSSCGSCAGSATTCLTCANNRLATADGKCVTSCPDNAFSSSGKCITCHPDCATCSGSAFNQCSSCPSDRPVLSNGRCLPTCSQSQYYDATTSSCQSCDSSCSSCSGPGSDECLACSSSSQVLREGSCVAANCDSNAKVISSLGVCLSELVKTTPTGTGTGSTPTVSGIDSPTVITSKDKLEWWQILLMALGCAFIFMVVLMLWRRHARKRRAKLTAKFASAKNLAHRGGWRDRLARFFGGGGHGHDSDKRRYYVDPEVGDAYRMRRLAETESARNEKEMESLLEAYERPSHDLNRLSGPSLYSAITGKPRSAPEPKQPVRDEPALRSRFSGSSWSGASGSMYTGEFGKSRGESEAEEYANRYKPQLAASPPLPGNYWLHAEHTGATGASGASKNPFRR
ncbi:insulin-like growth factor binding protein [Schizophyllum commune]